MTQNSICSWHLTKTFISFQNSFKMMLCHFFLSTFLKRCRNFPIEILVFAVWKFYEGKLLFRKKYVSFKKFHVECFFCEDILVLLPSALKSLENAARTLNYIILNLPKLCFKIYFIILVQTLLCTHLNNSKFDLYWFSRSQVLLDLREVNTGQV